MSSTPTPKDFEGLPEPKDLELAPDPIPTTSEAPGPIGLPKAEGANNHPKQLSERRRRHLTRINQERLSRWRDQIDLRRQKVTLYLSYGFNTGEIARKLGTSYGTAKADVKAIGAEWAEQVKHIDVDKFIGNLIFQAVQRKRRANQLYLGSNNEAVKIASLKLIAEEDERIVRILQSVGKLYKQPEAPQQPMIGNLVLQIDAYFDQHGRAGIENFFRKLEDDAVKRLPEHPVS